MDVLLSLFQPPFIRKTSSDRQRLKADCEGTWEARLKGGWGDVLSLLTGWLSACFDKNVRMNGKEVMTDLVGRGVICSYIKNMPSFSKKTLMFLKKTLMFFLNIKVFLQHASWFKMCTYASGIHTYVSDYTYGAIGLHIYTHRLTRTYVTNSKYVMLF